ncbi:MAG: type II 3-dehydroquinate dehydratase [Actinomycetes bacterium]
MLSVLVINGPNLGRLGSREPEVYGNTSYDQLVSLLDEQAAVLGIGVEVRQSDSETDLVHWIHEAVDANRPVILNPAAFTHYSYALRDACAMMTAPLIEVHLSNPAAREEFRHTSVISGVATGTIAGFGAQSYVLALHALVSLST